MENRFTLPTDDGHLIYGVHHAVPNGSRAAVIMVHGLTGHMDEYVHLSTARVLAKRGIAVFRFNQYDDAPQGRRFRNTTIQAHVHDTRRVIEYVRSLGFMQVALIGHSLGAVVSIAAADDDICTLILWDPSGPPKERIKDWETRDSAMGISYLNWRTAILLGESWIEDAKSFPDPFETLSVRLLPVQIIAAENGGLLRYCEKYRAAAQIPPEYIVIPQAGHTFVEEGALEALCDATESWLRKHFSGGSLP